MTTGRVGAVAVAMLVLLMTFQLLDSHDSCDSASYGAGYAAASNGAFIRSEMTSTTNTSTLCGKLFRQALKNIGSDSVIRDDFVSGCEHAVVDAME